jgi:acetyl esterase/lipase
MKLIRSGRAVTGTVPGVADSPFLKPFVLPVEQIEPERHGNLDLYLPADPQPGPAVVFVHGGPLPPDQRPTPRDWPVYRAYGSLAASRGAVGVTVDHALYGIDAYPVAAADVVEAVTVVREDPRVDPDRLALWFFSGGGLLLADWLRTPPDWLRCVAASYPILGAPPGFDVDPRFRPAEAVAGAGDLPIVLTRVGRERPAFAATVEEFVTAAQARGARLTIVDVPDGQHAFDILDDTDESRDAIRRAFDAVLATLSTVE